jgi:hypothetical protein
MIISILGVILLSFISCTDPYGYRPDYPDLMDPPLPPVLISPLADAVFLSIVPTTIKLEWQHVVGAEYYKIEIKRDTLLLDVLDNVTTTTISYPVTAYGTYYWRVCADSRLWKWYTEWSGFRRFSVINPVLSR